MCDVSTDMLEWEQRLRLLSTDDIPASLQKPLLTLGDSGLLLPNPHKPVATKWQPLPDRVDLPVRVDLAVSSACTLQKGGSEEG